MADKFSATWAKPIHQKIGRAILKLDPPPKMNFESIGGARVAYC